MSKTLAEIAIDAGLVNKADAARAGRLAETKRQPLIVVMVRDLKVDEVALVAAMRDQTRVPLLDPSVIHLEVDALRELSKEISVRLRVLPLTIGTDAAGARVMRVVMADPTDTSAIAELEQLTSCEIEVTALPLSAVEEWIERAYQGLTTAVVKPPRPSGDHLFVSSMLTTTKLHRFNPTAGVAPVSADGEISETARIAFWSGAASTSTAEDATLELRLAALTQLLIAKEIVSEEELEKQLQELLQARNGTRTT